MFLTNVFNGLKKGLGADKDKSKSVARSRLQFVLVQDRAGMSSDEMGKFKLELIGVIQKYFNIEQNKFDITYKREGETTTLLINSPVVVRRLDAKGGESKKDSKEKKREVTEIPAAANEGA